MLNEAASAALDARVDGIARNLLDSPPNVRNEVQILLLATVHELRTLNHGLARMPGYTRDIDQVVRLLSAIGSLIRSSEIA